MLKGDEDKVKRKKEKKGREEFRGKIKRKRKRRRRCRMLHSNSQRNVAYYKTSVVVKSSSKLNVELKNSPCNTLANW